MALVALLACGREMMLPRPDPLPEAVTGGLAAQERVRLADIRRFLSPYEQGLVEASLAQLAADPRLDPASVDAGISRAIARSGIGTSGVAGFCERLAEELAALQLTGQPAAEPPSTLALAVPIDHAFELWLSEQGRQRFADARALARAVRDAQLETGDFDAATPLAAPGRPLFLTDAASFEGPGPSAASRQCLDAPPTHSFVIAAIPAEALRGPLRVPTAADAVCRPRFVLPAADAASGTTCSGYPEYVSDNLTLSSVESFRLSR